MYRRRSISPEIARVAAGLAAMKQNPQDADELARIFGIDAFRAQIKEKRENTPTQISYLYLVDTYTPDGERYYKIGKSIQPHIRLQSLRTGRGARMPPAWQEGSPVQPFALRLGGLALESQIHRDLHMHRVVKTEWFTAHPTVDEYIIAQDAWNVWDGKLPNPDDFAEAGVSHG